MTLTRRRFLTITAAALGGTGLRAATSRWQGRALGGDVSITLHGPSDVTDPALEEVRHLLARVEAQFSLFDPSSALSRLNRNGALPRPDPMFLALAQTAGRLHRLTNGLFDPSVQPLWRAIAEGGDLHAARAAIGWDRVGVTAAAVTLAPGQALTWNGIAQGYATDLVADLLQRAGLTRTLVNIGEYRGTGGPWMLGIEDPTFGALGTRTLHTGAMATSSPLAMPFGGQGHILHPSARPQWSSVSVEAADATTADGFSTALTLAPPDMIRAMVGVHGIRRITLVDRGGDLTTLS